MNDVFHLSRCAIENKVIIQEQNIFFARNKWTCITGQSGIGKTTLLKCLAGLKNGFSPIDSHLSYMPQHSILLPWKTVTENVQIKDRLTNHSLKPCDDILKSVGLEDAHHLYPYQLSFGMQKRVLLAQILYNNSDFVLLDEPFAGIDPKTRSDLYKLCKKLLKEKTVFHVTHDTEDIKNLAHSIWNLYGSPALIELKIIAVYMAFLIRSISFWTVFSTIGGIFLSSHSLIIDEKNCSTEELVRCLTSCNLEKECADALTESSDDSTPLSSPSSIALKKSFFGETSLLARLTSWSAVRRMTRSSVFVSSSET